MSFIKRLLGNPQSNCEKKMAQEAPGEAVSHHHRSLLIETMEERRMLTANPLVIGAVYIEGDGGTDAEPDQFYVSFEGGSSTSNVTRIVIDGNQNGTPGTGDTDVYFDVIPDGVAGNHLGVGGASGFQWSADSVGITAGEVSATVVDGGTRLVLDLIDLQSQDVLAFTIDVDQFFSFKTDDQVTSGIEFAGSAMEFTIDDTAYHLTPDPSTTIGRFEYDYAFGSNVGGGNGELSALPSKNGSNFGENRTAGAIMEFDLTPRHASIAGTVYHDRNNNGIQEPGELGISGVTIELLNENGQVLTTHLTDANGDYRFDGLPASRYSVRENQPLDYLDGIDTLGSVNGLTNGVQGNDEFSQIVMNPGDVGVDYDFGEIREAIIEGTVHTDLNDNCRLDPAEGELPLPAVIVQLLNETGTVLDVQVTDPSGGYRFDGLLPGVYSIRQIQPSSYFSAGETIGSYLNGGTAGGGLATENLLSSIVIMAEDHLVDYNFCEAPAATISGFVFQDGSVISLPQDATLTRAEATLLRDGQLTPDDQLLAGVVLELRNGITGDPITGDQALSGTYSSGPIRTTTGNDGFYQFTGLPQGNYGVFEIQPAGFVDHIDTAGTNSGIPINPTDSIDPFVLSTLSVGVDPANDAILRIAVNWGDNAQLNNFSEIATETTEVPTSIPPTVPPFNPPISQVGPKFVAPTMVRGFSGGTPAIAIGGLSAPPAASAYSWHLSVINGGSPRGDQELETQWNTASYLSESEWSAVRMTVGIWSISKQTIAEIDQAPQTREVIYGMADGIPLAGDFNGDGTDELMMFSNGFWFVDINGNTKWDREDLWAELGSETDFPVVGDWDGDGKDDIGIYGLQWPNDLRAIDTDPGLPDLENDLARDSKNIPPSKENAAVGHRKLKIHANGKTRADLIDHVFRFGSQQDLPVTGDWNGDGVRNIGVFNNGDWKLDTDGDGRLTARDSVRQFGRQGDLPVVGDFNGDGIEQLGVFRGGTWMIDSNGNGELEVTDKVFELGTAGDKPVVGDFDGDGIDEPSVYNVPSQIAARNSKAG